MYNREPKIEQLKCGQRIIFTPTGEKGIFAGYTWDKWLDRFKYCSIHLDNGNTMRGLNTTDIKKDY